MKSTDKERKKAEILVCKLDIINEKNEKEDKSLIKAEQIRCPECGEIAKIK